MQRAFAHSMRIRLAIRDDGYDFRPDRYDPDLVADMLPNHLFDGSRRLAIYNQQYWFRLLDVMQREYPLLRHLLGLVEFNRMATDYLEAFPSRDPSLNHLTDRLGDFLALDHRWNRRMWRQAQALEYAHVRAFDAAEHRDWRATDADGFDPEARVDRPLRFQGSWFLLREDWDLVACRRRAAEDVVDEAIVEPRPRVGYWAVYRGPRGVAEEELEPVAHAFLARLAAGEPLSAAVEAVAEGADEDALIDLGSRCRAWFRRWTSLGWFVID